MATTRGALGLGVLLGLILAAAVIAADHVTPHDARPCSIEAPC